MTTFTSASHYANDNKAPSHSPVLQLLLSLADEAARAGRTAEAAELIGEVYALLDRYEG